MDQAFFEKYVSHYPFSNDALATLIGLVVGQRISFVRARAIRQSLYQTFGKERWCLERVEKEIWPLIPEHRHAIVRELLTLASSGRLAQDFDKVKGIGPWTVMSFRLMTRTDPDIFLLKDSYVTARLTEWLGHKPTSKDGQQWAGYRSLASLFFWRVTADGIQALKRGEEPQFL